MSHATKFHSFRWISMALLLFGIAGAVTLQAQQDLWVLPGEDTWMGRGLIGSPTDPSLVPVQFNGEIFLVPPNQIAEFIQKGGKLGWPEVVVPMIVNGKPEAVPIWKVAELLRKGAQLPNDLVIMHKGREQIAVQKSRIAEYEAKGYTLGPRDDWTEARVMCFKNRLVVVAKSSVDKYKKQGAKPGPCKK